jgi:hypothetical protein
MEVESSGDPLRGKYLDTTVYGMLARDWKRAAK